MLGTNRNYALQFAVRKTISNSIIFILHLTVFYTLNSSQENMGFYFRYLTTFELGNLKPNPLVAVNLIGVSLSVLYS